jgi:hypothetical protein
MKRQILEQPSYLGRERRIQIAIRFAKDDRDRDLQLSEYSTVDQRVLLVQSVEQTRSPNADGRQGIRLRSCRAVMTTFSDEVIGSSMVASSMIVAESVLLLRGIIVSFLVI